jgi:hypothetical protein
MLVFFGDGGWSLTHGALQGDGEELLGFHGKLHGQLIEDVFAVTVYNQGNGLFGADAPLVAVKNLVFANFGGGGFVFHAGRRVLYLDVGEGV